jgi:hypothetical protein
MTDDRRRVAGASRRAAKPIDADGRLLRVFVASWQDAHVGVVTAHTFGAAIFR